MKHQHVDPAEAVQIHRDLQAKRSIAIHWGTFNLSSEVCICSISSHACCKYFLFMSTFILGICTAVFIFVYYSHMRYRYHCIIAKEYHPALKSLYVTLNIRYT